MSFQMRDKCSQCGSVVGNIIPKNGQDVLYCECGQYQYSVPKTESGKEPRTVTRVHNGVKPNQKARVLLRDNARCALCGGSENLHVGHLLSVADGLKLGLTESEINDDENLAAMCEECNLGLSDRPVTIRLLMAILKVRLKNK